MELMVSGGPETNFCQSKERPEPYSGESGHCQALWIIQLQVYNGLNSISTMGRPVRLTLTLNGLLDSRRASRGGEI